MYYKDIRTRGGSSKYRGLSFEQVGVLVALDRDKNVISEIYGRGKITTKQISNVLENSIETNSVLVTDSCRSYVKFASDNNLVLKQIESGKHKNGIYHINNVNSYHSGLKDFIRGFKGISTKYLNNYLNWFKWVKSCQSNQDLIKNCLIAV